MAKKTNPNWTFQKYSVSVPKGLAQEFSAACKDRGRTQSWVIAGFMRQYLGRGARDEVPEEKKVRRDPRQKELPGLAEKART